MHSISTSASFGRRATSTALRAGQAPSKNVAYTPFMAAKLFMSLRKTVVLMTFSMAAPAAARNVPLYCLNVTPQEELDKLNVPRETIFIVRDRGTGRPTKKERRELDGLMEEIYYDEEE